ncbi:hypothetical protein [Methylomonas sp. AM2-LC]|uniref:hypothetical protein n=1 Tax=Methylomonas sp. AM2-LC TaxID=3153301 RepID=UPI0032633188
MYPLFNFALSAKNKLAKKQTLVVKQLLFGLWLACLTLPVKAELLGKISDETEQPTADKIAPAPNNQHRITYRVICSPEGEVLPDCEKPPLEDSADSHTSTALAEDNAATTEQKTEQTQASDSVVEPGNLPKKSSAPHKRHHKAQPHSGKTSGKQTHQHRKNKH